MLDILNLRTFICCPHYVGVDDNTLALFENQYPVQPMGVSYNSYVILDEKIAVMDSVDARAAEEWLSNVARVLEGRRPDYLVVTHMEPDHSGSLMRLAQKYPEMKIVGNAKTFTPVSYTHLDVYKRQVEEILPLLTAALDSGEKLPAPPMVKMKRPTPPKPCLLYTSRCV